MSQPMEFPRPGRILLWAFLFVFLAPIVVGIPTALWLSWRLDPVQNYYLGPYLISAIEGGTKGALVPIRYPKKMAAGRSPAAVLPGDAVGGMGTQSLSLSPKARAAGWRSIAISPVRTVKPLELQSYLQATIYDGTSAWMILSEPVLCLFAGGLILGALRVIFRRASRKQLAHEERHGRRTKGPELVTGTGLGLKKFWLPSENGIQFRMAGPARILGNRHFIPKRLETSHILLMGDTGSGKSSAIRQLLRQIKERGESAIVYDPAMDFVGEFYSPERGDLILNPLDSRCPWWDLRAEVSGPEIAMTIAAAMLPENEHEKAFFTDAPRRVLARLLSMHPKVSDLLQWMSNPEDITERMKGTPQASLVDMGAPAQRAGVLSSLNMIADSLELLPAAESTRQSFRTGEWRFKRTRWVFLTSAAAYREKLLPIHSVWLDLFILRMMEPCLDQRAKPVWFVLDELASLNKLPQLHAAVTENRKYGNPVVMGLQGRSQMEKRYGQDAEAMLSQPATKIFLKTSEPRAAKWVSDAIGEVEVERLKESRSMEMLGAKRSYSMDITTKPLVMPSEIAGLAPLHGYIKYENRVVAAHFELAKKQDKQPAFLGKTKSEPATESLEPTFSKPQLFPTSLGGLNQDIQPLDQHLQPLAKHPEVVQEGFVWDTSREIE